MYNKQKDLFLFKLTKSGKNENAWKNEIDK